MVQVVELLALRAELAHCRNQAPAEVSASVQTLANLIVTAETSLKRSDMYAAWAFIADTPEARAAFQTLSQNALSQGD